MATVKKLLSAMIDKINAAPKTINGIAPDVNGNIEIAGGGASSWIVIKTIEGEGETPIITNKDELPSFAELSNLLYSGELKMVNLHIDEEWADTLKTCNDVGIYRDFRGKNIQHFVIDLPTTLTVTEEYGWLFEMELYDKLDWSDMR